MNHTEVVDSSCGYKFIMSTHVTSRCGVVKIEVEIENVSTLYAKLLGDEIDKEITPFEFAIDDAEDREHILLFAKSHTIINLTVEVDSKVRDEEYRPLYAQ